MRRTALALCTAILAGCTPSYIALRPQTSDQILGPFGPLVARVRVPDTGSGGLDVRAWSMGVVRHESKAGARVSIPIDLVIENRSESVMAGFDPRSAVVTTALTHDLSPVTPAATGDPSADTTTTPIEPGGRRFFHLVFETDATDDPREVAPFLLRLTFEYGRSDLTGFVTFVSDEDLKYAYYNGRPYYGYPYYGPYYTGARPGYYYGGAWGW